jgi:hypothetical protein
MSELDPLTEEERMPHNFAQEVQELPSSAQASKYTINMLLWIGRLC